MRRAFENTDAVEKSKLAAQALAVAGRDAPPDGRHERTRPCAQRLASGLHINWSVLPVELRNPDPNVGMLKGDPYENWPGQHGREAAGTRVESEVAAYLDQSTDAMDLFDRVAFFTNSTFFSAETISGTDRRPVTPCTTPMRCPTIPRPGSSRPSSTPRPATTRRPSAARLFAWPTAAGCQPLVGAALTRGLRVAASSRRLECWFPLPLPPTRSW